MANATKAVLRGLRSYRDEILTHSWATLAAALQTYPTAMVGLGVGGYLAKFDDTATMRFFGVIAEDQNLIKLPIGTAGDGTLDIDIKQPPAFELAIAGVAITDIGRRVYALDDQTGTLDPSATSFANYVGVVKDLVYAANPASPVSGFALVKPDYSPPNGDLLQVLGASGAIQLKPGKVILSKAGVGVMTLALPTTGVHDGLQIKIQSSTAQAHTVTTPAAGYNATSTIATFGGAKGDNIVLTAFGVTWLVESTRNVTLS